MFRFDQHGEIRHRLDRAHRRFMLIWWAYFIVGSLLGVGVLICVLHFLFKNW